MGREAAASAALKIGDEEQLRNCGTKTPNLTTDNTDDTDYTDQKFNRAF